MEFHDRMKNMTRVVNITREPCDIMIDRTTIWGNPYSHKKGTAAKHLVKSRKEAIEKYREHLLGSPELMERLPELRGKVLGCWCKPKQCHGDVIVELLERRVNLDDLLGA